MMNILAVLGDYLVLIEFLFWIIYRSEESNHEEEEDPENHYNNDETTSADDSTSSDDDDENNSEKKPSKKLNRGINPVTGRPLWNWADEGYRRPGSKGKAKKLFHRSVSRDNETINVGDCAVFLSTARVDRPYIGNKRVKSLKTLTIILVLYIDTCYLVLAT